MLDRLQTVFASFQKHEVKYVVIGGIASVQDLEDVRLLMQDDSGASET